MLQGGRWNQWRRKQRSRVTEVVEGAVERSRQRKFERQFQRFHRQKIKSFKLVDNLADAETASRVMESLGFPQEHRVIYQATQEHGTAVFVKLPGCRELVFWEGKYIGSSDRVRRMISEKSVI